MRIWASPHSLLPFWMASRSLRNPRLGLTMVPRDACIAGVGVGVKQKPDKRMPPPSAAAEARNDVEAPPTQPQSFADTDSAPSKTAPVRKGKLAQQELMTAAAKKKDAKALAAVEGFEVRRSAHNTWICAVLCVTCCSVICNIA